MAHWFQHYGAGIAEGIIASVLFAVAIAFTRVLAEKAKARRYRVAGWYLTRFTYLRRDESSGAITEYTDDDSKALLHLKQRGLRFHGMIQTPQSRATFSCRGRITDTYQLYGRYRENRRRAAYQVFFHVPRLRGDNPAREFKGMWCGYSAVEDRLTSGFDAWRELLRVRVIQVTADKMSPDVDRILKRAPSTPATLRDHEGVRVRRR